MKIGILTFCCAHNFGAALQCYALVTYLSSRGHDVRTINYCPEYLVSHKPQYCSMTKEIGQKIKDIAYYIRLRYRYRLYETFSKKYFHLTEKCHDATDLKRICTDFDYVVIGSDQVWNGKYNGNDKVWWGGFAASGSAPKLLAYAASAGNMTFGTADAGFISEAIKRFTAVSVREGTLNEELTSLCGLSTGQRGITTVLDPTLLLPYKYWRKWRRPDLSGRYIVIYQGDHPDDNIFHVAQSLKKKLGCKIVVTDFYYNNKNADCAFKTISPKRFVTLVMNAECVLTNSFHGVALSIACRTNFYSFPALSTKDQRITALLVSLGLQNRAVTDSLAEYSAMDYDKVNEKLNVLRTESDEFIKSNIV